MRRFVRCCLLPRPTPANECVGQGMRKYEKGRPGLGIPPPDGRACFPPWVDSDLLCSKNHWTTSSKNLSRSSSTFKFLDFLYQELHFEMDLTLSTSSSLSYITPSDQRGIFTGEEETEGHSSCIACLRKKKGNKNQISWKSNLYTQHGAYSCH
ncbi:uncharacterized protein LOC125753068 isoform X8 [Canis lupus dingo]|uniref:uncharacterized protein LOC125753068 isoform X8 n=1 Tax=Canis lupus dingo TaxID=286419 RepID=UPI0020C2D5FF|nr:uncharacterized protein LOC125753068 isoform X8 [Canis lupus dingo]